MKGMPLIVAAQVLGHSTTRMVERHYGHLTQGYVQQAVEQTGFELPPEPSAVAETAPGRYPDEEAPEAAGTASGRPQERGASTHDDRS
jgi:hypothetical protein